VVVPSLGHRGGIFRGLSALAHHELREAESILKHVQARLAHFAGEVMLFEHGHAEGIAPAGCGISHAHLHIVVADAPTAIAPAPRWRT